MHTDSDAFMYPVSRITLVVDGETLAIFKAHAEMRGEDYQKLMSEALKRFARDFRIADMLTEEIRQEDA